MATAALIGSIERIDQQSGDLVKIEVALARREYLNAVTEAWKPDPTFGSTGAMFKWDAIGLYWPDRSILRATWDEVVTVALLQLDDDYPPFRSRPIDTRGVYVSFLEVAPFLRTGSWNRRFVGIGAGMLTFAVTRSHQLGFGGRVGLHSIKQTRHFYAKLGFPRS